MPSNVRRRQSGERLKQLPLSDWNRFVDAANRVESMPMVSEPPSVKRRVKAGVIKTCTAATWNNSLDELTPGEFEVYPFSDVIDDKRTLDRSRTLKFVNDAPEAFPAGSLVKWLGKEVVVCYCSAYSGWS